MPIFNDQNKRHVKKITKRETLHVKYIQEGKKLFIQVIGVFSDVVNITSYSSFNDFSYAQHVHVHLTPCTALEFIKHTEKRR